MRNRTRGLLAATAITVVTSACGSWPAAAQDRDRDRIAELEAEVRDLQSVVYSVERPGAPIRQGTVGQTAPTASGAASQDIVRIARLEEEIAALTGRIEELTFRLAGQQRQIETIMAVLGDTSVDAATDQMMDGQEAPDLAGEPMLDEPELVDTMDGDAELVDGPTALSSAENEPAVGSVDLPANEDDAYDVAYEALLAGDYARSEAAFEAYTEQFPEGVRIAEAKYFLGQIYLSTGAYAEAANTFLDHVKNYPDDVRAPEAYLKLGTSFARLEKPEEACKVFRVGASKFPNMSANVRAQFDAEQRKATCAS